MATSFVNRRSLALLTGRSLRAALRDGDRWIPERELPLDNLKQRLITTARRDVSCS